MSRRWHWRWQIALLIVGLLPTFAPAQIRSAEDELVDIAVRRILETLPKTSLPLPSRLAMERDVYLFVGAGAATLDVRVLARPSVSPEKLAQAIHTSVRGTALDNELVEWARDDEFTAVRLLARHGHIGQRYATMTVPVGKLVEGLKTAGFVPHVLLRLPLHIQAPSLPFPKHKRRFWTWYAVGEAAPDLKVTVTAKVPATSVVFAVLFPTFVPMVTLLGIFLAILLGSWKRLPIERRRRLYPKLAIYPTFGAMAVHAPFALYFLLSPHLRLIADVWFGSLRSSNIFAPMVSLSLLPLFLIVPVSIIVERKLFGQPESVPAETEEERTVRLRGVALSLLTIAIGMGIIVTATLWLRRSPLHPFLFAAGMIVVMFGPMVMRFGLLKQTQRFVDDEMLTERVQQLAVRMGVAAPTVKVDESPSGQRYAFAMLLPSKSLVVSRKALQVLTPDELEAALAHELAHLKLRHLKQAAAISLIGLALVIAPMIAFLFRGRLFAHVDPTWLLIVCMPASVIGLFWMFFGARWISRQREYAADRVALEVTRNFPAAVSSLQKMAKHSPLPFVHEVEDASTHPALSKRLERLRAIARSLGLPTE